MLLALLAALAIVVPSLPQATTPYVKYGEPIRIPEGWPRIVQFEGTYYLNTDQGFGMPMNNGRCSYITEWRGKFYADQDFSKGPGVGRPKKGAELC